MVNGDAFQKLDPLLQHKVRLGACIALSQSDALSFTRLKEILGATDGNLGAQLTKLEEHRYISASKEFVKRKPVTWYALTTIGKKSVNTHIDALQGIVDSWTKP